MATTAAVWIGLAQQVADTPATPWHLAVAHALADPAQADWEERWAQLCQSVARLEDLKAGYLDPWQVDERLTGTTGPDYDAAEARLMDEVDWLARRLAGAPVLAAVTR